MENESQPITLSEATQSFASTTAVANRFMITTHANGIRIAFGESFGDGPIFYRVAVLLNPSDIAELVDVLNGIVRPPAPAASAAPDKPRKRRSEPAKG